MDVLTTGEGAAVADDPHIVQTTGTVIGAAEGGFAVRTGGRTVEAKRAVSCLAVPEEGDLVLLAGPASGVAYLVAVLERPGGRGLRIPVEGDCSLEVPSGRFAVHGAEGVDLVSGRRLALSADRVEVRAREGRLFFGTVRLIAGAADSILERLFQAVTRSFRRVEEVDQLRAGQIDHAAEGLARLHGEHTLVTARELVKADGRQIHVG